LALQTVERWSKDPLLVVGCQLSVAGCQLSVVRCPLLVDRYSLHLRLLAALGHYFPRKVYLHQVLEKFFLLSEVLELLFSFPEPAFALRASLFFFSDAASGSSSPCAIFTARLI
jgi:hypothetical protein